MKIELRLRSDGGNSKALKWQLARLYGCMFVAICSMVSGGCGGKLDEVANDEAKKRALAENKSVDQAAIDWFYPRRIEDYFPGMDAISQPTDAKTGVPDQLLVQPKAKQELSWSNVQRAETKVEPPAFEPNHVLGRNTWMIWCAGNEGFWDWLASDNLGFIDLLKLLETRKRNDRFRDAGLINEPKMAEAASTAPGEFGLWLDMPQDARIRQWRQAYLEQTFAQIAAGAHKSQRGLHKNYAGKQIDLYRGKLSEQDIKYAAYDSPSSYLARHKDGYGDDYGRPTYRDGKRDDSAEYYDAHIPPPDIYGLSSGVVGLRLFPNPYFDAKAQEKWDAQRYYQERDYFTDPSLVRPFRVGMSCAFCHASFHPLKPPIDVTHPEWENVSGNIGAQYLSMRATVGNLLTPDLFAYHLLESQPRGTIDTSLIASDNINNPNTMNAVFNLPQRALLSFRNPPERLSRASAELPSLWRHPDVDPLHNHPDGLNAQDPQAAGSQRTFEFWGKVFAQQGLSAKLQASNDAERYTPRILLDGSDSIGAWGALARVYLNIGSYWERWNQVHQPVLGLNPQQPFLIQDCESNSVYWNATELRVGALRDYFLTVTPPMPLLSTEGALERLKPIDQMALKKQAQSDKHKLEQLLRQERAQRIDLGKLERGREVYARNCIVCHSSIQPESSLETLFGSKNDEATNELRTEFLAKYESLIQSRKQSREQWARDGEFWDHDPGQWLRDRDYVAWAREIVSKPEFWQWNYLSTDYRIPINVVKTNSARAMATNSMSGHVWEDFASESYRTLPSPGAIEYFNPYAGEHGRVEQFTPRHRTPAGVSEGGGGPGYYRVPSLVSIWATAPFLHNNSLGLFNNDPSVKGRLEAFDDAIHKLLYPERRLLSSSYNAATPERLARDRGLIWRTTEESYLVVEARRVPFFAQRIPFLPNLGAYIPWLSRAKPLWLPSGIFFVAALLILSFAQYKNRRTLGYLAIVLAIVLWIAIWLANYLPGNAWLAWLVAIQPALLPVIVLVVVGVILLLPLSRKWTRYAGYGSVLLGLVTGFIVFFNAGKLGDLTLGPIPKGTPVNLVANLNSESDPKVLKKTIKTIVAGFSEIQSRYLDEEATQKVMRDKIAPALLEVNKCPDFVMDHGHYFEWFKSMTDEDKEALIELLKTF